MASLHTPVMRDVERMLLPSTKQRTTCERFSLHNTLAMTYCL